MKSLILNGLLALNLVTNYTNQLQNYKVDNNGPYFLNYQSSTQGITSDNGTGVAFGPNSTVGYVSTGGALSIGTLSNDSYTFQNYNSGTSGITNDNGTGVAFDTDGDVAYVSTGGALSIGTLSNGSYTFQNYNSGTTGITNNTGTGVAFGPNGTVGYVSDGGALSIGTLSNGSYTFQNYSSSVSGIISNNGQDVAFDSNGNVGYASSNGGALSIGTLSSGSYTFQNYNTILPGITNSTGQGVAFNSNGDVAYASLGGAISIGTLSSGSYTFQNYNSSTSGIAGNNGRAIAFAPDGKVGYAASVFGGLSIGTPSNGSYTFVHYASSLVSTTGYGVAFDSSSNVGYSGNSAGSGGLSVGFYQVTGSIDTTNIVYERNAINQNNFNIGGLSLDLNLFDADSLAINDSFFQIEISNSSGDLQAIIYATVNGIAPPEASRPQNIPAGVQQMTVQVPTDSRTITIGSSITGISQAGFADDTQFNISASYGPNNETDSQTNLLSAPVSITTPDLTTPDEVFYNSNSPITFSKNDSDTLDTGDITFSFNSLISDFVNSGNGYLRFVVESQEGGLTGVDKIDGVSYVTPDGNAPADPLTVNDDVVPQILNGSTNATTDVTTSFSNLTPDENYRIYISLGTTQNSRVDLFDNLSPSYISFETPPLLIPTNPSEPVPTPTPPPNNGGDSLTDAQTIGLGVGLGVGIPFAILAAAGTAWLLLGAKKRKHKEQKQA